MMESILRLMLAIWVGLVAADKAPICVPLDGQSKFCTEATVEHGNYLSDLLRSAAHLSRPGKLHLDVNKPFSAPIPKAEGVFAMNRKLDAGSRKLPVLAVGPESLIKQGDNFYAAAADGIYKINPKTNERRKLFDGKEHCKNPDSDYCSRPLGIRANDSILLCADAHLGLISVDLESGESRVLLPVGANVDGTKLVFPDDLDVDWEQGMVYMSDGFTKWPLQYWMMSVLENDPSGRIVRYNLNNGEASVFSKNLRFPNGVQLTADKKSLLVSELSARRILRFPLDQPLPVHAVEFTKTYLPGNPDNIRPSRSGGYWVALCVGRVDGQRTLVDEFQARPGSAKMFGDLLMNVGDVLQAVGHLVNRTDLTKIGFEMKTGSVLLSSYPEIGTVLELDADGNVLQTLYSSEYTAITQASEEEEGLYLGSFLDQFMVFVSRANFQRP